MIGSRIKIALLLATGLLSVPDPFHPLAFAAVKDVDSATRELLVRYCTDCHGQPDEEPERGFALGSYLHDVSSSRSGPIWKKALDAIEGHEMPPGESDQPTLAERLKLASGIRLRLQSDHSPGKPVLRRLTRLEYNNTVRDLLGLTTDVFMFSERQPFDKRYFQPGRAEMPAQLRIGAREYGSKYPVFLPDAGLPGDSRAEHGFTNRGDAQSFSESRLEQYVRLAEQIAYHPDLLKRAARMQELLPHARFEEPAQAAKPPAKIIHVAGKLASNNNVRKTAPGSAYSLESFRERLSLAYQEDRGGIFPADNNLNSTVAGKGGVLRLAYGENARRVLGINPNEDLWVAPFATAVESSGEGLFTNKIKEKKQFFLRFQGVGGDSFVGVRELGLVLLSRRGQSGVVRVTAEYSNDEAKTLEIELREGAGTDNTFVSFAAQPGVRIRQVTIDGSQFSGPYVLLDDLAWVTWDAPSAESRISGRELPTEPVTGREVAEAAFESPTAADSAEVAVDRAMATRPVADRLRHFIARAFRRPITDSELTSYLALYREVAEGAKADEQAMRAVIHAVLSSPSFLFRFEKGVDSDGSSSPLSDDELASRLSYFLWSTMPDDILFRLAAERRLRQPQVLAQQVERMLQDRRASELSENFFVEWLRLRELWSAQPDDRLFREFYDGPMGKRTLAREMFCEALLLFETILVENRSILEFVDSKFTYANPRLAKLYDLPALPGGDQDWFRVSLPDQRRGGILTLGATLTLTSFPHRTSPIRRGSWFLETLFNRPPPPPTIAVADLDEQSTLSELATLREKVQQHRANPACAVCHDRIDPPGFALEKYDAIGRWREQDTDHEIDDSGQLRGVGSFQGPEQFKQQLRTQADGFVRGFCEHLLSYALARPLDYRDVSTLEQLIAQASQQQYRLHAVIQAVVDSPSFQHIDRNSGTE